MIHDVRYLRDLRMVPTKRFWALVAAGIPIAAVAAAIGTPSIAFAYDAMLLIVAYGSTFLAPSTGRLILRRKFDTVLSVRAANKITLTLENDGVETIRGLLRDEPPPLFDATRKE